MNKPLKWSEVLSLSIGDRVVFVRAWDIFPETIVAEGVVGTVVYMPSADNPGASIKIKPDNDEIRTALADWDGNVLFYANWNDSSESPIARL